MKWHASDVLMSLGKLKIIKRKNEDTYYLVIPLEEKDIASFEKSLLSDACLPKTGLSEATQETEHTVSCILREIGVPANIRGFYYIRSAVLYVISEPEKSKISKNIYSYLTEKYNTDSSKLERSIRYAVGIAFDRGAPERLKGIFGDCYSSETGRPTNLETIHFLAREAQKPHAIKAALKTASDYM